MTFQKSGFWGLIYKNKNKKKVWNPNKKFELRLKKSPGFNLRILGQNNRVKWRVQSRNKKANKQEEWEQRI